MLGFGLVCHLFISGSSNDFLIMAVFAVDLAKAVLVAILWHAALSFSLAVMAAMLSHFLSVLK